MILHTLRLHIPSSKYLAQKYAAEVVIHPTVNKYPAHH